MEFSPDAKRAFKLQSYYPTRPIDGVNIVSPSPVTTTTAAH